METSAKANIGVEEAFFDLARFVLFVTQFFLSFILLSPFFNQPHKTEKLKRD